ncbi:MAG: (d)CMP kinase [Planctomycetota bacterium]|jgi:cytidylate kinase
MADLIVTIDGPAASGKSTVARLLAEKLDASFLDTGAMYRAITLAAMQAGVDLSDQQKLLDIAQTCDFKFSATARKTSVRLNKVDVTDQIRDPEVTTKARHIAGAPNVRAELVRMQRQFAAGQERVVTEGRDQGTVAFADADVKFFLTADAAERARRRQVDLKARNNNQSFEQIQRAIEKRDESDENRAVGPLKPADDAIVVDTTELSIDEVVEKLLSLVKERCLENM